ncbi:MAG: CAP domain-containing protein [Clostridiales bacterium]|nr:CAP domain-containing protein [Clostridiales bacterium]
MKFDKITKLISKNVTTLSIASAFVLGAIGMSDMRDKLFDTSSWFMKQEAELSVAATETVAESSETVAVTEEQIVVTLEETTKATTEATTAETTKATTTATSEETTTETTPAETSAKETEPKKTSESTVAPSDPTEGSTKAPADEPAPTTTAPAPTTTEPAPTTTEPAPTTTAPMGDLSGTFDESMARAVLDYVNNERAANGLAPLSWNNTLANAADIRATEIVVKWSHTRPDGSAWWTAGARTQMGENLAFGQSSAEEVVAAWMNSQTHRDNILCSDYSKLGVSCYFCNGTYYWTQEFA